jgi:peptidase E
VPAETPTIVATSIGFPSRQRGSLDLRAGPIYRFAAELARPRGTPRLCLLATATGDAADRLVDAYTALREADLRVSHLSLFPMPNVPDVRAHLLSQDVIWVGGGSVVNLWRCGVRMALTASCTSAGRRES